MKTTGLDLFAAGYPDLVSVIPPGARLSPSSRIDETQRGKVPGKKYPGGWGGYAWRDTQATPEMVDKWTRDGANFGLHAANFPGVDIDCTDAALAETIRTLAVQTLGEAPQRTGRAPKTLLVYFAPQPFRRMRLWLTGADGEAHLVEVLGDGQQYVVAGKHPSGVEYDWIGAPLHETSPLDLNAIDPDKVELFFDAVAEAAEFLGFEVSREGSGVLSIDREAIDQQNLMAPSYEIVAEAVAAIPNDNDTFPGRDDYLRMGYAIKASAGEAGLPLFLDWAARWEGNDRVDGNSPEEAEADWSRMAPPFEMGWEWLAGMARRYGFSDAQSDFEALEPLPPSQTPENAPAAHSAAPAAAVEASADPGPPSYSDGATAMRLINRYGGNLRYCGALGGWVAYKGGVWSPDETLLAEYLAGKICTEMSWQAAEDASLGRSAPKEARRLAGAGAQAACLNKARSDRRVVIVQDQFDADPWALNTPAGVVDLRTGAVSPHELRQYHTKMTRVAPEAKEPTRWLRFLQEATAGDTGLIDLIHRKAGYWLTGLTREHDITFIWGPGGNGKSVLVNTLAYILGGYAAHTDSKTFAATKQEQHPEAIARLRGARLVLANETSEGMAWNEARVKQATGGDVMTARHMNQGSFEFRPVFKLAFVGNHKPRIANLDAAMKRRFHLLPFTVTPKIIDKQLEETLREEAGAILAWAIEGCRKWQAEGMALPRVVQDATDEYFTDEDPVGRFIEERCVVRHDATSYAAGLFEAWRDWAHEQNEPIRTARWLTGQLAVRPGLDRWRCTKTGQRGISGLELLYNPGDFEAQPAPAQVTA